MSGPHRATSTLATVLAVFLLAPLAIAEGEGSVRLVAQPADEADGLPAGERVHPGPDRDTISIDSSGAVLFGGGVRDTARNVIHASGYFVGSAGTVRKILVLDDPAPIAGDIDVTGYTAFRFETARMNPDGDIALDLVLRNGAFQLPAYITEIDGTQRTAAMEFVALPGICELQILGSDIFAGSFALNGGSLVFPGRYRADTCPDDLYANFHRKAASDITPIIAEDDAVPGAPSQTFETVFSGHQVNANAAALFNGQYRDGDVVRVLLLAADASNPSNVAVVAQTGGTLDGETVTAITSWILAQKADGSPRVAYIANSAASYFVVDLAAGATPLIRTGSTFGAYTFDAGPTTGAFSGWAVADDGRIVAVADTMGPGLPADGGDAVWRFDPRETTKLQVVLHEGGSIPGSTDARTIERIITVNVAKTAAIAIEAELSDGNQVILLEDPDSAGDFVIAVEEGDDAPSRTGTVTLITLQTQVSTFPRVTGPGTNGLQSRFNEQHQFVFHGRANFGAGPIESGVFVVSLDGAVKCDVEVKLKGSDLSIVGGDGDCEITVESTGSGNIRVIAGRSTSINGNAAPWAGVVNGDIDITMKDGDDHVVVRSTQPTGLGIPIIDVFGNLEIDGGDGEDDIEIEMLEINGSLVIDPGDGLTDRVRINDAVVIKKLKLTGGAGTGDMDLTNLRVTGKTAIKNANRRNSDLALDACTFGKAKIMGGIAADRIHVSNCTFGVTVKFDMGRGAEESLALSDVTVTNGAISIKVGSVDATLALSDVETPAGGLKIKTGGGGADIAIEDCAFLRKVTIKTSGAGGATNDIAIRDTEFGDALSIKGKGTHDVEITDGCVAERGLAINLKGGASDRVVVTDATVQKGLLQVAARSTTGLVGAITDSTVVDGSLNLRSKNGADTLTVTNCTASRAIQVSAFGGDDTVAVNGSTCDELRLFGGDGDDMLDDGGTTPNTARQTKIDGF